MKSIKLKWIRTSLVGSVTARRPRGTPFVLSYLAVLQPLIQQMPKGGFASPEGISQLRIGLALDALVAQHAEELLAYETEAEAIQAQIQAMSKMGGTPEQLQEIRDHTWDMKLPGDIELLLEDAQHAVLVELVKKAEFNVPTLAVGAMKEEIENAPTVQVTKK